MATLSPLWTIPSIYHRRFMCWWPSALFVIVAPTVYLLWPQYLLYGHDGKSYFVLLSNVAAWNDATPLGLSISHLAGMSGVIPPLVPKLIPTLWPFFISTDPYWQIYLTYVLSAVFLYFSTQLMARSLGFDSSLSLAAAWTAFFFCMLLHDIVLVAPIVPPMMIWCNLMVALFARLGRGPLARTLAFGLCFVGLPVWLVAAMSPILIIAAPGLALLLVGLTVGSSGTREALIKIGWAVLALTVLVLLRIPEFIELVSRYTARVALSQELEQQAVRFHTAGPVFREEWAVWVLLAFGLGGAAALLWSPAGIRPQKALAAAFLLFFAALTCVGSIYTTLNLSTPLPAPLYFTWVMAPVVALFATVGAYRLLALTDEPAALPKAALSLGVVTALLAALRLAHGLSAMRHLRETIIVALLFIAAALFVSKPLRLIIGAGVLAGLGFSALESVLDRRADPGERFSLTPSPLTDYLRQRVGLHPGGVFAGAIDHSYIQDLGARTLGVAAMDEWFKNLDAYGSGYQTFDWHYFDIPTLSQFQQYITPSFYYLYKSLLNRPEEPQTANHLVLSKLNTRALAMMGARYLVANHEISTMTPEFEWRGMRIFGIDSPNLFVYSPTRVLSARDAGQGVVALQQGDMDPRTSAVVIGPVALPMSLAPVDHASAIAISGGWKVHAVGRGSHMLLMPVQFSHCWEVAVEAGDQHAHLIRANVAMTALIFENEVTAAIRYRFQAPNKLSCRRADYEEDQRIGIIR
jgi:hypothetical protein